MPQQTLSAKIIPNKLTPYYEDANDNIKTTGVVVDDAAYDTGSFLDRDYDVRLFKEFSIQVKNVGANSIDITVLESTRDFTNMDTDLEDTDFSETGLTEEAVAANAYSTIYNLLKSSKPGVTAVRLRAKETLAANPGTVRGHIKGK